MLDDPTENDNKSNIETETIPLYSDVRVDHKASSPLRKRLESKIDLQDISHTWSTNFSGLDSGVMREHTFNNDYHSRI